MMIVVLLSLFEYVRAFIFTGFPWLMPSMVLSGNEYFIQAFSYIGSFACNLVVITLSVLPFIIFSNIQKKIIVFLMCFIPITSLFLFSFLVKSGLNYYLALLIAIVGITIGTLLMKKFY